MLYAAVQGVLPSYKNAKNFGYSQYCVGAEKELTNVSELRR